MQKESIPGSTADPEYSMIDISDKAVHRSADQTVEMIILVSVPGLLSQSELVIWPVITGSWQVLEWVGTMAARMNCMDK